MSASFWSRSKESDSFNIHIAQVFSALKANHFCKLQQAHYKYRSHSFFAMLGICYQN